MLLIRPGISQYSFQKATLPLLAVFGWSPVIWLSSMRLTFGKKQVPNGSMQLSVLWYTGNDETREAASATCACESGPFRHQSNRVTVESRTPAHQAGPSAHQGGTVSELNAETIYCVPGN
jgi:hypothetical protein